MRTLSGVRQTAVVRALGTVLVVNATNGDWDLRATSELNGVGTSMSPKHEKGA